MKILILKQIRNHEKTKNKKQKTGNNTFKVLKRKTNFLTFILAILFFSCSEQNFQEEIQNESNTENFAQRNWPCPSGYYLEIDSKLQFNFRKECEDGFSVCLQLVFTFDCVRWVPELSSTLASITSTPQHILNNFDNNPDTLVHFVYHPQSNKVLMFVNYDLSLFDDVVESDFNSIDIEEDTSTNYPRITLSSGTYEKQILTDGNLMYVIDVE